MLRMPLDLHAKGSAPACNIQIEPNLTKQKCQFMLRTVADPLACTSNGMLRLTQVKVVKVCMCYGQF